MIIEQHTAAAAGRPGAPPTWQRDAAAATAAAAAVCCSMIIHIYIHIYYIMVKKVAPYLRIFSFPRTLIICFEI